MKSLAPLLFTLLYLVAMVRPIVPVIDFIINQDYIAEFLCINADKPELECNGKCYLMQMVQKQKDQKKESLPEINLGEYPIGFVFITAIPAKINSTTENRTIFSHIDSYSYQYNFSNFHPPTLIS